MPSIDPAKSHKMIGRKLRTLREALKKSINTVAVEAKMSPKALTKIEAGESKIRILTLRKLCIYYKVTLDDLMEDPVDLRKEAQSKGKKGKGR
jgi:transcriptional regulator with XRE-family HTH domain